MPLPPLTHHEILELVAPFSRRGRRVDLDATNRLERRLVFKATERPLAEQSWASSGPGGPALGPLRERLELASPYAGSFKLTRTLTPLAGPAASLVVEGADPGELLEQVEAVPPDSQFRTGDGWRIALGQVLEAPPGRTRAGGRKAVALLLTHGTAEVAGLTLEMKISRAIGYRAELKLVPDAADTLALPEDFLSVVGWDWAPLHRDGREWTSRVRLRGKGAARSRRAEAKLERTVKHIATALRDPPARYHERFAAARWGVVLRRTLPLWTALILVGLAFVIPKPFLDENPNFRLVLLQAPVIIVGLSLTLQEGARVEIPPLPRRMRARDWRSPPQRP